jgi:hypothetical protein
MSPLKQFTASLLGAAIAVALGCLVSKHVRRHLIRYCCMAIALAFTLPLYGVSLGGWRYGVFALPFLSGGLGGAGLLLGAVLEGRLNKGRADD